MYTKFVEVFWEHQFPMPESIIIGEIQVHLILSRSVSDEYEVKQINSSADYSQIDTRDHEVIRNVVEALTPELINGLLHSKPSTEMR